MEHGQLRARRGAHPQGQGKGGGYEYAATISAARQQVAASHGVEGASLARFDQLTKDAASADLPNFCGDITDDKMLTEKATANPITGKQSQTFKGIDSAWSGNPAKSRRKHFANIMADKIRGYHPALARAVVSDTVASGDFARSIDNPPSESRCSNKTGRANDGNRVVRLPTETARKMAEKQLDIT
ncbi:MAG: hypothetical protein K0U36_07255 [Alphaproteobacteria bacterium]|nr:hypothetical protein [Alphaproteobacteria bacterium]